MEDIEWFKYGYKVILIWMFIDVSLAIISLIIYNLFAFFSIILCSIIKIFVSIIAINSRRQK